jgi:hypothetical protein
MFSAFKLKLKQRQRSKNIFIVQKIYLFQGYNAKFV